jgi:HSP20 family protein
VLLQNDPFRDFDTLFDRLAGRPGTGNGNLAMPMDAYRRGSDVWVHLDLPGVAPDSIDISVERNVLTVSAERSWQREEGDQMYLTERHRGVYRRQVHLGDGLDAENIEANFVDGVLTLRVPVAEQAKPRKITVGTSSREAIDVGSVSQS